jgi:hypothetical protein
MTVQYRVFIGALESTPIECETARQAVDAIKAGAGRYGIYWVESQLKDGTWAFGYATYMVLAIRANKEAKASP